MDKRAKLEALRRGRPTRLKSLRQLLMFQVKLAADAVRDLMLSPVSIFCFVIDALGGSTGEHSLHDRLMRLGQRSDRFINLFDEYSEAPHSTIDNAINELESRIRSDGSPGSRETGLNESVAKRDESVAK